MQGITFELAANICEPQAKKNNNDNDSDADENDNDVDVNDDNDNDDHGSSPHTSIAGCRESTWRVHDISRPGSPTFHPSAELPAEG